MSEPSRRSWLPRGTRARLMWLLAAVVLFVLFAGAIAIRAATLLPSVSQFVRMIESEVALAEQLYARDPATARGALAAAGLRLDPEAPVGHPLPRFNAAQLIAARLDQRYGAERVRFEVRPEPVVWIRLSGPDAPWLGVVLEPLGVNLRGALFWMLVVAAVTVLVGAVGLARGLTRPLERLARAAPALVAGEHAPLGGIGATREIEALAQALREAGRSRRAALEARERLLAEISHDLRTPLARLQFALELGDASDPAARAAMRADLDELDAIVGQALAYLRDGREEPAQAFDLGVLVGEVVDAFRRREPRIACEAPASAPFVGKRLALRRALGNLVDNALRHGLPPVHVVLEAVAGGYRLVVADSGSPDAEPGPAPPGEPVPARRSYGLGLAIVRAVASQHQGTLALQARAPGTAAVLTLRSG